MGFEPMFKDESLSPKPSTFLRGFKFSQNNNEREIVR